jgi:hypothetical protein
MVRQTRSKPTAIVSEPLAEINLGVIARGLGIRLPVTSMEPLSVDTLAAIG